MPPWSSLTDPCCSAPARWAVRTGRIPTRWPRRCCASRFPAIDTSNRYASGHSEEALGRAIARIGLPDGTVVLTKVDADTSTGVFDGDRVRRSFEESLARLGLDRLPLLQIHDPYTITLSPRR